MSLLTLVACSHSAPDLVITNASLFNPRNGQVEPDRTVVIREGVIARVITDEKDSGSIVGRRVIDGRGRLLVPGFIDVHHHTVDVLGDTLTGGHGPVFNPVMLPDSIEAYRKLFALAYCPYGVTTVRGAGTSERYMPLLLQWMRRRPDAPDFFPAGAALVSTETGRKVFAGHVAVGGPNEARAKVRSYHDLGLHHVKLYWRLRQPEFDAALEESRSLRMNVAAHIDFKIVSMRHAIELGLQDVEHAYTLGTETLSQAEIDTLINGRMPQVYGKRTRGWFWLFVDEMFVRLGPHDPGMTEFIHFLADHGTRVTPTLHIFAQRVGLSYFTSPPESPEEDTGGLSAEQLFRARQGYHVLASYVRQLYESGVPLSIGTDCREPGKAFLSEMLLLHDAGIPIAGVLTMATLNGARTIGLESEYGSIEVGKRANLVLFEKNPLEDPNNLLEPRTVIKDGMVWGSQWGSGVSRLFRGKS